MKSEEILEKPIGLCLDKLHKQRYEELRRAKVEMPEMVRQLIYPLIDATWEHVFGNRQSDAG